MYWYYNIYSLQDKKWSSRNWEAWLALFLISISIWSWFNLPTSWSLQYLFCWWRIINGLIETSRKTNKEYERYKISYSIKQRGSRSVGFNWCINKWSDLGKCNQRSLKIKRHETRNLFKSKVIWACFVVFVSVLSDDAKDKEIHILFVWSTYFCK